MNSFGILIRDAPNDPFSLWYKIYDFFNKKYMISLIRTILFNWNVFESMENGHQNGHLGPIFFSDGTYTWGSVIVCWWSCRTCVKDLLLSAELSMAWPLHWYQSIYWQAWWLIQHDSKATLLLHYVMSSKDA